MPSATPLSEILGESAKLMAVTALFLATVMAALLAIDHGGRRPG